VTESENSPRGEEETTEISKRKQQGNEVLSKEGSWVGGESENLHNRRRNKSQLETVARPWKGYQSPACQTAPVLNLLKKKRAGINKVSW